MVLFKPFPTNQIRTKTKMSHMVSRTSRMHQIIYQKQGFHQNWIINQSHGFIDIGVYQLNLINNLIGMY